VLAGIIRMKIKLDYLRLNGNENKPKISEDYTESISTFEYDTPTPTTIITQRL